MKKLLLLLILIPNCLFAQKRSEQTFDRQDIKTLLINSNAVFKISITAQPVQEISIQTITDGETYESSLLHTKIIDQRLEITTGRTPDFTPFNDKLSAHKVLSIELDITIPQDFNIDIYSTLAEVSLKGRYKELQINLGRGGLIGRDIRFRESVINTISGNVALTTKRADVTASSRNGEVIINSNLNEGPICSVESIYGDIEVLQVK